MKIILLIFLITYSQSLKGIVSLNKDFFGKRGVSEVAYCQKINWVPYGKCGQIKTCNFCNVNGGCGWCDETKKCIPVVYNQEADQMVPVCNGECERLIKIDYCYKKLFEPSEETEKEITYMNYNDTDLPYTLNISKAQYINKYIEALKGKEEEMSIDDIDKELKKEVEQLSHEEVNKLKSQILKGEYNHKNSNFLSQRDILALRKEFDKAQYNSNDILYDRPQFESSELETFLSELQKQKLKLWLQGYSTTDQRISLNNRINPNKTKIFLRKFYKDVKYNKTNLYNTTIPSLLKEKNVINLNYINENTIKKIMLNANKKYN